MQGQRNVLVRDYFAENLALRYQPSFIYLSDRILAVENEIWVVTDVINLPADLHRKVFQRLAEEVQVEPSILFTLLIPVFGLLADSL